MTTTPEVDASTEREQILTAAREIEPGFESELSPAGPGRFERSEDARLSAAIELLIGCGAQDDFTYDPQNDICFERVGRWIVARSEEGFWLLWTYANVAEAVSALDRLGDGG